MGFACKNWCERFKLRPKSLGDKKRCSICCVNFRTKDLNCRCCGSKLRTKSRYKSKTGPRTSYPELDRNREENHRKLVELLKAKVKANADKIAEVLPLSLFMTARQISFLTGISPYVVLYTCKRFPERFGTRLPPAGHKSLRIFWLKLEPKKMPLYITEAKTEVNLI